MSILKLENVSKVYESNGIEVKALSSINLEIMEQDFMVIAGPSGSGKTTLLNLLGSLDVPTEGKVLLNNEDLSKKKKKELSEIRLRKLGFVFQAYNLIPVLTAIENIEFSMMLMKIPDKERKQRAIELMTELKIDELADKLPNQMSGGQQQRVAVARAIVHQPMIVLADEPTANLDSKTGASLLDLMQKLNSDKKITFIFSSHDKQVMERAERLVLLKDGMISNYRTPDVS